MVAVRPGVAAPEAANNAASTGSFVPLLTLGIPGSGTTAVLLGVMLSYGLQPGPRLLVEQPEIFWGVIASMYVGNVLLLGLNLPLIPQLAKTAQTTRYSADPGDCRVLSAGCVPDHAESI